MPVSAYFKGRGESVLADMRARYGAKKGTSVFYATANTRGMKEHMADLMTRGHFKKKKKKGHA